jgi:hypothetical protein
MKRIEQAQAQADSNVSMLLVRLDCEHVLELLQWPARPELTADRGCSRIAVPISKTSVQAIRKHDYD